MGKLQQHRIEDRKPRTHTQIQKQLIEEIKIPTKDIHEKENKSKLENISSDTVVGLNQNYVLLKHLKGTSIHFIGVFQIPKGVR